MSSWSILIPVINTAHAPGPGALFNLRQKSAHAASPDDEILFVWVEEDPDDYEEHEAWMRPIAEWMGENYKDQWVRFDSAGDVIEGLPTYPDKWD